jgi:hypothetical protein
MDFFTVFIIAGFFLLMGAAIVGLIWYLQGVSKRMSGNSKNSAINDPNLSEVVRLMRNLQTQDMVVVMDGKALTSFDELTPAQQRRLSYTFNVLAKWLGQPITNSLQMEEPVTTPPKDAPEVTTPIEPTPVESKANYTPPFFVESVENIKPVSTDLPDMVGGILNPAPQPTPAFSSIAMQINEILQAQLAGTKLESRGITLQDGPDRGVMVTLDGKQYNGVMDVPDEKVRTAIRAAVVDWETRK